MFFLFENYTNPQFCISVSSKNKVCKVRVARAVRFVALGLGTKSNFSRLYASTYSGEAEYQMSCLAVLELHICTGYKVRFHNSLNDWTSP